MLHLHLLAAGGTNLRDGKIWIAGLENGGTRVWDCKPATDTRTTCQVVSAPWAARGALKVCWISGWYQCALVLRCDLTLHRWPAMGSPSGRGPRDSAHASGGCSVAYNAQVPVPNYGSATALRRLAQSSSQLRGGWGPPALSRRNTSSKKRRLQGGVAVRARDSSNGGG